MAFCIPATTKLGEISEAFYSHLKARGNTNVTEPEAIVALASIYPCSPASTATTSGQLFTHAREAVSGTLLHQYIGSQEHHRELGALGIAWDHALKSQEICAAQRNVMLKALMIYEPIVIE